MPRRLNRAFPYDASSSDITSGYLLCQAGHNASRAAGLPPCHSPLDAAKARARLQYMRANRMGVPRTYMKNECPIPTGDPRDVAQCCAYSTYGPTSGRCPVCARERYPGSLHKRGQALWIPPSFYNK